jgi:dihydroflavonol-4-reductase
VRMPYAVALGLAHVDQWVEGSLLRREPRIPLEGVRMAAKKMYFDATKAVHELGLPQTSVEDALARAARWFADHGYARAYGGKRT